MTQNHSIRPRRSCLYMPGNKERALQKARTLPVDTLLLDLEDAVGPSAKVEARERVCETIAAGGFGHREVVVRINGLDSAWGKDDLEAMIQARPEAILLPKVESVAMLQEAYALLQGQGAQDAIALWAMIETPLAVLNVAEIAGSAGSTGLRAFVVGTNDLAKEMRLLAHRPDRQCFLYALSSVVTAARAFDLVAIDGVFNSIADEEGLEAECRQGADLGFDGKSLIHPSQIAPANAAFSPETDAVNSAREVIECFELPENAGKGVITIGGKMVELLHLEEARRLVALNDAIERAATAS